MSALLAAAPLAVVVLGMGVLRLSAAAAGTVGLALAALLSASVFALAPAGGALRAGLGTLAEAIHATVTILWIILPALALFEFQQRSGAIDRIRDTLAALTDNRRVQTLLIAWFFALFIEGAAGFGTPVALAAPLLVGLGFASVRAVALALLGHAAGVSFGAVGTPVLAQVTVAGLPADAIALRTAVLHALAAPVLLLLMVRLAGDGRLGRADVGWSLLAALCFLVPSVALAALAGPELATLGAALLGAALFVALLRRRPGPVRPGPVRPGPVRPGPSPDLTGLRADLAPYLVILALVLGTRLVPPLRDALSGITLAWSLDGRFSGSIQPLYHPGTMLLLGLLAGALASGRIGLLRPAAAAALRRVAPVALALVVMLALSRLMVHAGMIGALASAAAGTGPFWPLVAPLVGVLGTFVTGSATASNILFTELQLSTAAALSLPPLWMVAAQGFGAAIGNTVAPHNIIAGSATVGLVGREGEVLRRTAVPCAVYALLGGLGVLAVAAQG